MKFEVFRASLQRMRRHVKRKGMTLAAFVRQAIEEKLEREDV